MKWVMAAFGALAGAFGLAAGAEEDPTPEEVEAVLSVVDAFFVAYHDNDIGALRGFFEPEAYLRGVFTHKAGDEEAMRYRAIPVEEWLTNLADDEDRGVVTEVYWDPTVHITQDTLASVWAHYELQIDGKTDHCGVDLFTLVAETEGWKIADVTFTLDTTICDVERPADLRTLRPRALQKDFVAPDAAPPAQD